MIDLDYTVLFQAAIFLILMAILQQLLFKPYLKLFNEREKLVSGMKEDAVGIEKSFHEKSASLDAAVREATLKASAAMEKIRTDGQNIARDMIAEAREKSAKQVEQAVGTLKAEAESVRMQMHKDIDAIALQIAEKVLGRKIA
jgi:F-type H+-transporting ATPase subunit b